MKKIVYDASNNNEELFQALANFLRKSYETRMVIRIQDGTHSEIADHRMLHANDITVSETSHFTYETGKAELANRMAWIHASNEDFIASRAIWFSEGDTIDFSSETEFTIIGKRGETRRIYIK